MEALFDSVVKTIFAFFNIDKEILKEIFQSTGNDQIWILFRDYLFNYKVWIMGLLPCILLEKLFPAKKDQTVFTKNLLMDAVHPIFNAVLVSWFYVLATSAVIVFFNTKFSYLNLHILDSLPSAIQVSVFFVLNDFLFYLSHYIRHRIRWLWHFHSIHHSQEALNALTTYRGHFGDGIASTIIKTLPLMVFGGELPSFALYLVLNNFWGYFIHANIRTNLGPLRYILVSPQFHRVHHSCQEPHFDKNFGERLILWDWLFGTMVRDFDVYPETGVNNIEHWVVEKSGNPFELTRAFFAQLCYPFFKITQSINNFTSNCSGGTTVSKDGAASCRRASSHTVMR